MQWLSNLWNSFTNWLGRAWEWFINWLVNLLERLWDIFISSILLIAFGYVYFLYVIFYVLNGDIIMEAWNPKTNQPSERLRLGEAPKSTPLPKTREDAKIHGLTIG